MQSANIGKLDPPSCSGDARDLLARPLAVGFSVTLDSSIKDAVFWSNARLLEGSLVNRQLMSQSDAVDVACSEEAQQSVANTDGQCSVV